MELFSEKQITRRAPIRPLEANYVNADVKDLDSDDGYQLQFPQNWASHGSTNKVIGIRRLLYKPFAGNLRFTQLIFDSAETSDELESYINENSLEEDPVTGLYTITKIVNDVTTKYYYDRSINRYMIQSAVVDMKITSSNTLSETLHSLQTNMSFTASNVTYTTHFIYDSDTLTCTIKVRDASNNTYPFRFIFAESLNQNVDNFLKIFNQKIYEDEPDGSNKNDYIEECVLDTLTFYNVWNREDLYFHSSFSDSTRQIIGVNGDMWPDANVYYGGNLNSDDFTVRFTQDTVTRVVPRHGVLLIQFSLIYNYENTMVM